MYKRNDIAKRETRGTGDSRGMSSRGTGDGRGMDGGRDKCLCSCEDVVIRDMMIQEKESG